MYNQEALLSLSEVDWAKRSKDSFNLGSYLYEDPEADDNVALPTVK